MDANAMAPQGSALLAYFEGDLNAELVIHRDDGLDDAMPVSHFFRDPTAFSKIETTAIELCRGHVLDVGAGAGIHSLVLQQRGLPTTAIDISPHAVAVMSRRGVKDAFVGDVFKFQGKPFDTVLMLGHGIGLVETIAGLDQYLVHARELTSEDGQILLDSRDARVTDDPRHLAYHEANRQAGRYIGETRLHLSFQGVHGPSCGWLHVDVETLGDRAMATGWTRELIQQEEDGHYLARLTRV